MQTRPAVIRTILLVAVLLRRTALASLAANVGIVITGGAVRLTGSGLGCPTWPRCVDESYVPTRALGYHGVIEFSNRTLTGVVGVLAVAGLALALLPRWRSRRRVVRAALVVAGIPAQAIMGEFVVLSHLNPWLVAGHFLISIAVIALAYLLWLSTVESPGPREPLVARPLRGLTRLLATVSGAVIVAGTVVTGSGPHAGDAHARRTGLDPQAVAQLHTDLVMLLIGLSVALWFGLRATKAPAGPVRAAAILIGIELAQGVIGFTQYFTHLPAILVGLHMAGACAVWLATLHTLRAQRRPVDHPAIEAVAGTGGGRHGVGEPLGRPVHAGQGT